MIVSDQVRAFWAAFRREERPAALEALRAGVPIFAVIAVVAALRAAREIEAGGAAPQVGVS